MKKFFIPWRGPGAALLLAAATLAAHAATDVKTLGGGPNQSGPRRLGATDGPTLAYAKFRGPVALALDTNGSLLVADQGNGKVRKVSRPGAGDSLTSTFASRLASPVGIAVDASNLVYVLTQRDGKLRKFNGSGALLQTVSGFRVPTALALGRNGDIFVLQLNGVVQKLVLTDPAPLLTLDQVGGQAITGVNAFRKPRGLAFLPNGDLAVAESTGHAIWRLSSTDGLNYTMSIMAGGLDDVRNPAGLLDGTGAEARFNAPYGLATAPNGALVVTDRLNHRLRVIDTNLAVTSLYGVPRAQWMRPFPGWVEGAGGAEGVAASRDPMGVTVSSNGTVYVGEIFWGLLRAASGTGLGLPGSGSDTNGGGGPINTNLLVAPLFGPNSGYFPFGVTITVTSAAPVYYTTDGTDPTTNSASVALTNGLGSFRFTENLRDLTSLRLKAISLAGESTVISGQPASANEFGIPRDFIAGSGARILVPVVANLRAGARVKSFFYRVEITPQNGAPPIEPYLMGVPISVNNFVPVKSATAEGKTVQYTTYTAGNTVGVFVTALGTNTFVDIEKFATTTLLAVPISSAALDGDTYTIRVLQDGLSATSDGAQQDVPVFAAPARTITVQGLPYLVGDVAVGEGYNAGEFGDGKLKNNDVNAVMFASFGIRVPFAFSDAFNAMDVHPTLPFQPDAEIGYFDWQVVLARSAGFDTTNVIRVWSAGERQSDFAPQPFAAAPAPAKSAPVGWSRQVTLSAGNQFDLGYGECAVPVSVKVAPGQTLAGLGFRVTVEGEPGMTPVLGLHLTNDIGGSGFLSLPGEKPGDVLCAWQMVPGPAFSPLLQGEQLLGTLKFTIPSVPAVGKHYTIRFSHAAGGPNLQTPLTFESIPGSAWIYSAPPQGGQKTSDEWRVHYFGSVSAAEATDNANPDHDGSLNWQEYQNGTNPTQP